MTFDGAIDESGEVSEAVHPDESFDRFARLVHRQLGVPMAAVTVLSEDEQHFIGAYGLPEPVQTTRRYPREGSYCARVIANTRQLIVTDIPADLSRSAPPAGKSATQDDGSATPTPTHAQLLSAVRIGAYAGMPIFDNNDRAVGVLCAMDTEPRAWTDHELATLRDLAAACTSELGLRLARDRAQELQQLALQATRRTRLLLDLSESFAGARSVEDVVTAIMRVGSTIKAQWAGLALADPGARSLTYTSFEYMEPRISRRLQRARLTDDRPISLAARTRRPLFYRTVAELLTEFPHLDGMIDTTLGARAFLPVIGEERLLGVIMLGWAQDRDFDDEAVKTELAIATYAAHALDRVVLLEARHETATTLQAAMLSPLPDVRRLELAFIYSPATRSDQVGGDWYDAVVLDENTTVLVVGDVTGHDMHAAAQMGQLRSMLRTFAWSRDVPPSALLRLLDRANHGLGLKAMGTAIVARLERHRDPHSGWVQKVTWANAGHPCPLVLRADGTVDVLDADPDIMLGVLPTADRHDSQVRLFPGDTLLLYTDGLVEHRGMRYADRLSVLEKTLEGMSAVATTTLPNALVRHMVADDQQDDLAVLAIRIRHSIDENGGEKEGTVRLEVADDSQAIGPARRWVDDILESVDLPQRTRRTAMLLTSELVTNAVQHAAPPIVVEVTVDAETIRIAVSDGTSEQPRLLHPGIDEIGGRGIQFLDRRSTRWGIETYTETGPASIGLTGATGLAVPGGLEAATGIEATTGLADAEVLTDGARFGPMGRGGLGRNKTVWFELDRGPGPMDLPE